MTKSAAIYSRAGHAGTTPLRQFAQQQGWDVAAELRDDPTLVTSQQPGLARLRKLLADGAVQIVVTESMLSIGTNVDDLLTFAVAVQDANAIVLLLDDGIDTGTASGAAWLNTLLSVARYRTHQRRAAVTAGQTRAKLAGVKFGRPAIPSAILDRVRSELAEGSGVRKTAKLTGISPSRVALEKKNMTYTTAGATAS
jgi:DNA invertase Pin-like site-specific DNA recombinase